MTVYCPLGPENLSLCPENRNRLEPNPGCSAQRNPSVVFQLVSVYHVGMANNPVSLVG